MHCGLYWFILIYSGLYWSILFYSGLSWSILVYNGLFWCVLVYTGLYCSIGFYTGLYWSILVYNGLCWRILVYTGLYWDPTGSYWIILGSYWFILGSHQSKTSQNSPFGPKKPSLGPNPPFCPPQNTHFWGGPFLPFFALFHPKKIRLSHRGVRYEEEKLETATPKKRNFGGRIWEPKVHFCQQNGAGNAFIPTTRFPTLSVLPNFTLFGPKRPSEQNVLFLFFSSPKMPQILGFF